METQKYIEAVEKKFGVKMMNPEKVVRTVYGMSTSKGQVGGVGEDATEEVILARYDQLGGFMTKGGYKVKHYTFCDKKGAVIVEPKVVLLIKMNGEYVEHEENTPETPEIKVAKSQSKKKKVKED